MNGPPDRISAQRHGPRVTAFADKFQPGLTRPPDTEWSWDQTSGVLGGTRHHEGTTKDGRSYSRTIEFQGPGYREKVAIAGLFDVLRDQSGADVHFCTYEIPGATWWPRLTKPILPDLGELGLQVVFGAVQLDFDNPGHASWSHELIEEHETKILAAKEAGLIELDQAAAYFRTRGGWRLIFALARPVSPAEYEALVLALQARFAQFGIPADDGCRDWTRLMRAPQVTRDGRPTWTEPYFILEIDEEATLDPDRFDLTTKKVKVSTPTPRRNAVIRRSVCPSPEEVNRIRGSEAFTKAKLACAGICGFSRCFEGGPPPTANRHTTLVMDSAAVIHAIAGFDWGRSPALVFACLGYLDKLGSDQDFHGEAWSAIETGFEHPLADVPYVDTGKVFEPTDPVAHSPAEVAELLSKLELPSGRPGGSVEWVAPPETGKTTAALDKAADACRSGKWAISVYCAPTREVAKEKQKIFGVRHPDVQHHYIEGIQEEESAPGHCQDYFSAMARIKRGFGQCGGCSIGACPYICQFAPVKAAREGIYFTTLDSLPVVLRRFPEEVRESILLIIDDSREVHQGAVRTLGLSLKAIRKELELLTAWLDRPVEAPIYRKRFKDGEYKRPYGIGDDVAVGQHFMVPFLRALLENDPSEPLLKLSSMLQHRKEPPEAVALDEEETPMPSWMVGDRHTTCHLRELRALWDGLRSGCGYQVTRADSKMLRMEVASPAVLAAFRGGRVLRLGVLPLPKPLADAWGLGSCSRFWLKDPKKTVRQLRERLWLPKGGDRATECSGWDTCLRSIEQAFAMAHGPGGAAGLLIHKADADFFEKQGTPLHGVKIGTYGADHSATDEFMGCRQLLVRPFRIAPTEAEHQAQTLATVFGIELRQASARELPFWGTSWVFREPATWAEGLSDLGQELLDFHNLGASLNGCGRPRALRAEDPTEITLLSDLPTPGVWVSEFFQAREELVRLVAVHLGDEKGRLPGVSEVQAALDGVVGGVRRVVVESVLRGMRHAKGVDGCPVLRESLSSSTKERTPIHAFCMPPWPTVLKELAPESKPSRERLKRAYIALVNGTPLPGNYTRAAQAAQARAEVLAAVERVLARERAAAAEFWAEQFSMEDPVETGSGPLHARLRERAERRSRVMVSLSG